MYRDCCCSMWLHHRPSPPRRLVVVVVGLYSESTNWKQKKKEKNIQKMCFNSCRLLTVHYCLFFLYSFLVFLFTSLFVFFKKFFGIFFWAHIRRWNFILVSERTSVRVFKIVWVWLRVEMCFFLIFVFLLGFLQKTSLEKQK